MQPFAYVEGKGRRQIPENWWKENWHVDKKQKVTWYHKRSKLIYSLLNLLWTQEACWCISTETKSLPVLTLLSNWWCFITGTRYDLNSTQYFLKNILKYLTRNRRMKLCDATFSVPKFPIHKVFDLFLFCCPCWANDWLMIELSYLSSQHAKRSPVIYQEVPRWFSRLWTARTGAPTWTCSN